MKRNPKGMTAKPPSLGIRTAPTGYTTSISLSCRGWKAASAISGSLSDVPRAPRSEHAFEGGVDVAEKGCWSAKCTSKHGCKRKGSFQKLSRVIT